MAFSLAQKNIVTAFTKPSDGKITYLFVFTILLFCNSCGGFKYKLISETETLKVKYIDSKKIGERVMAELRIGNKQTEYEIHLGYAGVPLHIIRYTSSVGNAKRNDNLDFFRSMEFLVTDTIRNNNPNYLGNAVNGYYHDTSIYMKLDKLLKVIRPVSKDEYLMFNEIKRILEKKGSRLGLQEIDSSKVLGWFKYEF